MSERLTAKETAAFYGTEITCPVCGKFPWSVGNGKGHKRPRDEHGAFYPVITDRKGEVVRRGIVKDGKVE